MPQYLYVVERDGVNIRSMPSVNSPRVGGLRFGTEVLVSDNIVLANGYVWRQLATGRYVAQSTPTKALLVPRRPAGSPPDVIVPQPPRQTAGNPTIGINFVGPGKPEEAVPFCQALNAAGQRNIAIRVTNGEKALSEYLAPLSDGLKIFRFKDHRADYDPRDFEGRMWSAVEWFDRWYPVLAPARAVAGCVLEFTNEVFKSEFVSWYVKFYVDLAAVARARGVTITLGNFSVASFDSRHHTALAPLVQAAIKHNHIVAGNTYWYVDIPDAQFRFDYLWELMRKYPTANWAHTEYGWAREPQNGEAPGYVSREAQIALHSNRPWLNHVGHKGDMYWCDPGSNPQWKRDQMPRSDYDVAVAAGRR